MARGKTQHINLFLAYHSVMHVFAERMRKKMVKEFNVQGVEFVTLCTAHMMCHKKGFFTIPFVSDMRDVDQSVTYRTVQGLIKKGFIIIDGKTRKTIIYKLTKLGYKVVNSYSIFFISNIKDFEKKYWPLQKT